MLKISDCPVKNKSVLRQMSNKKRKNEASKKVGRKELKNCSNWEKKGGGERNGLYYVCPVENNC